MYCYYNVKYCYYNVKYCFWRSVQLVSVDGLHICMLMYCIFLPVAPKHTRGVGRLLVIIIEGSNLTCSKDGKGQRLLL